MTPYRSASREVARKLALCPACAARVVIDGEDDLRCQVCGARDSALRVDHELRSEIELRDSTPGSYKELRDAAASFGADLDCTRLVLGCDGLSIEIGLDIDSGIARGLSYSTLATGLPDIVLRREDDGDTMAKESGVAREVQTGDDEFDRAVYIESDAADQDVLEVLAAPGVRAAVRNALKLVSRITIVDRQVRVDDLVRPQCFDGERIRELATALRVLAGATRRTTKGAERETTGAHKLAQLVYLLLPTGIAAAWIGGTKYSAVAYGPLIIYGVCAAIVFFTILQPFLRRAVAGRSTSHRELTVLRAVSFTGSMMFGIGLSIFLNGALDRSAPWIEDGVVTSAEHNDETGATNVAIRGKSITAEVSIDDLMHEVQKGDPARMWLRAGAFGQPWKTQATVVTTAKRPRNEK